MNRRFSLPAADALRVDFRISLTLHEKEMITEALRIEALEHRTAARRLIVMQCFALANEHSAAALSYDNLAKRLEKISLGFQRTE